MGQLPPEGSGLYSKTKPSAANPPDAITPWMLPSVASKLNSTLYHTAFTGAFRISSAVQIAPRIDRRLPTGVPPSRHPDEPLFGQKL